MSDFSIKILLWCIAVLEVIGHNEATGQNIQNSSATRNSECSLPPHPQHGNWFLLNSLPYYAILKVPHLSVLKIQCQATYKLEGCRMVVCVNGQWAPPIGHCAKTCRSIHSTSTLSVKCIYKDKESVDCVEPREGTLAEFKCKSFYEDTRLLKPKAICIDGRWSEKIPECLPICGRAALRKQPTLIVHGDKTKKGEFPWQVALYSDSDKTLICGGSLLSERVVLTAAHCITDSDGTIFPKQDFIIVVGKYFRQFNHSGDSRHSQVSKIENMFISDEYRGEELDYVGDIAVMITEKLLRFSTRVQPVCIDWCRVYENELIDSEDEKGYVSGWGHTRQNSNPANELKSLRVPSISRRNCRDFLPDEYKRYMTFDKFCAGYRNNGTSVCGGDSGGGLVFKRGGRYFIAGIVSLAPLADSEEGGCDSQQYSLYTLVYNYTDSLILKALATFKPLKESDDEDSFPGGKLPPPTSPPAPPRRPPNTSIINEGDDFFPGDFSAVSTSPKPSKPDDACFLPKGPYLYTLLKGSKHFSSNALHVPLNTTLKISCIKKYTYEGPETSQCTEVGWSPFFEQTCIKIKTCPPLPSSKQMKITCTLKGKDSVTCSEALDNTVAKFECAPFYEFSTSDPKPSVCLKEKWSHIPKCVPGCGQVTSTSKRPYPWRVAIYRQKNLVCEGSLITTRIIVTAANCIAGTKSQLLPQEDFVVAVGKTHQEFDSPDVDAQISKLQQMVFLNTYGGENRKYESDIAVLVAEKPFELSDAAQLVCIDWGGTMVPPKNKEAFVSPSSEVSIDQKFITSGQECFDSVQEEFEGYYTQDKFCANFVDSAICKSTAGAGLVVEENNKYYLVGVSSLMPKSSNVGTCDTQYALFTRMDKYIDRLILQVERHYRD